MFRQHLVTCNCQLFPKPFLQSPPFRSPPQHPNSKKMVSKRSLKSQSNSRQRDLFLNSHKGSKINESEIEKGRLSQHFNTYSRVPISINSTHAQRVSSIQLKYKSKDSIFSAQQNRFGLEIKNNFISLHQGKFSSPLQIRQQNQRPSNHIKIVQANSPHKFESTKERSGITTLAGSVGPVIFDEYKEPFSHINLPATKQERKVYLSDYGGERQSFNKMGQNMFEMSRLSEMMNQKQQIESVYEGERPHDEGGVQYSRVLISCKKLMQQKNGLLQQSDHTKLFDYHNDKSRRIKNSDLFQKVNLLPSRIR